MLNLQGKKILIFGLANDKSIAYSITKSLKEAGAHIGLAYMPVEAIEKRVKPIAEELGITDIFPCDVSKDDDILATKQAVEAKWGYVDGLVHSVAYASKEDLACRFSQTSREGFRLALDVSAYSFIAVLGKFSSLMAGRNAAAITLTYLGAERVVKNYNVMGVAKAALESSVRYLAADLGESGIRVNAISAGPIKTLAASGIPGFREMLTVVAEKAPLKRGVTAEDVAGTALYLLSDLASGVAGEIIYCDSGYNIIGV